jgi:hypothetical protein
VQQAQAAQLHRSDFRMIQRQKPVLVTKSGSTEAAAMVFVSVLIAPLVMSVATLVGRHLGPSAAGWVAALPVSFTVAMAAVAVDAGDGAAGALALGAATHVPAQAAFAVVFAAVLVRRGLVAGFAAGAVTYAVCALALARVPDVLGVALALPSLALAPRLIRPGRPPVTAASRWTTAAMSCMAASLMVAATLATSRLAGPATAGAIAAFPTLSATLVIAVVVNNGSRAGAQALLGLVRSLPCYLTFCLVVVLAAPSIGLPAIAVALLACLAVGGVAFQRVPLTSLEPATSVAR